LLLFSRRCLFVPFEESVDHQCPQAHMPPQPISGAEHGSPDMHARCDFDVPAVPLAITPAPPEINLRTAPPQSGQAAISGSDIFWRRSKWLSQASQRYS
jgi:hypothetical protein